MYIIENNESVLPFKTKSKKLAIKAVSNWINARRDNNWVKNIIEDALNRNKRYMYKEGNTKIVIEIKKVDKNTAYKSLEDFEDSI